jgi:hypothetical protein
LLTIRRQIGATWRRPARNPRANRLVVRLGYQTFEEGTEDHARRLALAWVQRVRQLPEVDDMVLVEQRPQQAAQLHPDRGLRLLPDRLGQHLKGCLGLVLPGRPSVAVGLGEEPGRRQHRGEQLANDFRGRLAHVGAPCPGAISRQGLDDGTRPAQGGPSVVERVGGAAPETVTAASGPASAASTAGGPKCGGAATWPPSPPATGTTS